MSEITKPDLDGVAETLLITLYIRAMESQRPDALIKDERAEALVRQLGTDSLRKTAALTEDFTRAVVILKGREFDRLTQDFLTRHPDGVVVHIGCGLDTRFERISARLVGNDRFEWYDLDLPDVIELRRKLISNQGGHYHMLACSVLDLTWLETVEAQRGRHFLFLAEGVLMYFTEAQVKALVLTLRAHFPGAELVFDAFSPFLRWSHNLKVTRTRVGVRLHWALKHAKDLENWYDPSTTQVSMPEPALKSGGIHLLDERFPFQSDEPRIRNALKLRLIPFLARGIGVFHYQL